jgi:hypothetical protein
LWNLDKVPKGFWERSENRAQYVDWLGKQLCIKDLKDWYNVTYREVSKNRGGGLLKKYRSLSRLLVETFPHFDWQLWRFQHASYGLWNNQIKCKEHIHWLENQLGIQRLEDWYTKTSREIIQHGGGGLLKYFGSIQSALKFSYPEFEWKPWKFNKTPNAYWNNEIHVKDCVDWLSQQFFVKSLDDWYRISAQQMKQLGAFGILQKYKGMKAVLQHIYPQHSWDSMKLNRKYKSSQVSL